MKKTHISANFPEEPGPSPARGENLLPFIRHLTEALFAHGWAGSSQGDSQEQGCSPRKTVKGRKTQGSPGAKSLVELELHLPAHRGAAGNRQRYPQGAPREFPAPPTARGGRARPQPGAAALPGSALLLAPGPPGRGRLQRRYA